MTATLSISDPFAMRPEITPKVSFRNTAGRTIADPRLVDGEVTAVFVLWGQSLTTNVVDTVTDGSGAFYTAANPTKIDNLNVFDGGLYRAVEPMLGCSDGRGNLFYELADRLIAAAWCDRVILAPVGMGATSIAEWVPGGSPQPDKLMTVVRRLKALGLPVTSVLGQQGEQDAATGMPKSTYKTHMNAMLSAFWAEHGPIPWMLAKSTTYGNSANGPAIRAAVDEMVNGSSILMGPDCDLLNGLTYRYDYVHPNVAGRVGMSAAWATRILSEPSLAARLLTT